MPDAALLRQRALRAVRLGDFTDATRLLARARRAAGDDPDLIALISLSEAYLDAERSGSAVALARCRALVDLPGLAPETRGTIWSQLGLLNMRAGNRVEALAAYDEAIPLLHDHHETLARALLNRANVHLYLSAPQAAVDDLDRASAEFGSSGDLEMRGKVEHNLGYAHLLAGDLVAALKSMDEAARTLAPMTPVLQSVSDQDRAEVLLAAGRPSEAAKALRAAADAYGAQRLRRFQAECELVLARTLLVEDPAASRTTARRAARRFESHDSPGWATRARGVAVIAEIALGRRSGQLVAEADALAVELRSQGHPREADQIALHAARLAVRRGDLADAARRLARVRTGPDTPVTVRLLAREVRAELASTRGHGARARSQARAGLAELHEWQSTFGSLDLQTTLVAHGRHLAMTGLGLALDDGSPTVVLEWSERARALASRVTPVRPPPDLQVAADLGVLRGLGDADPARARELRDRIRQHSWYAAGGGRVDEPAGMDELVAGLAATDAALVAYLMVGDRLHALVVSDAGGRVVPLGDGRGLRGRLDGIAADLDMAAARSEGPMAAVIRASLTHRLGLLAADLVAPVLALVGDRRVVLTPSGLLAGTPWSLLEGYRGRPLTVAPSATRWLALRSGAVPGRRVGLIAGPHVDRAAEEVTRAARSWTEAEVLTGDRATTRGAAELAGRVDVLHLAGHGRHSGDNPLFSAVELADGPWFGHDIDTLDHTPDIVVLSACELGRVSVRSGEESVGMTAAWLHSGARHVLSSPALVADALACESLADWHALVAAGAAPADALAEVGAGAPDGPPMPFLCFGAGW